MVKRHNCPDKKAFIFHSKIMAALMRKQENLIQKTG